ncbi:hypothetical protein TKK_0004086 [Trichogramma kaykai]|uniref:C-type lectin domain-containing protein n=1 Tax=Trichogramma kaykai TaxID=54128 RepID=A0ABD2XKG9_9HYME
MLIQASIVLACALLARASPTTTEAASSSSSSSSPAPSTEINLCPCGGGYGNSSSSSSSGSAATTPATPVIHGMTCMCHSSPAHASHMRDDYKYSPGVGAHKLHTRAATWNEARKLCNEEGGHLAIINSLVEAHVMRDIFQNSGPVKGASYADLAYVGIHDLYKEGEWVSVLGESLYKTGYTAWSDKWGGQPDNGGGNQNCGAFMKDSGGLDDVNCDVSFAFFCEIPMTYIIH